MKLKAAALLLPLALGLLTAPLPADSQKVVKVDRIGYLGPGILVPTAAQTSPVAQRGRFVIFNFDRADIEVVIHAASEIVGFNYVLAPQVKGRVTVQTSRRIREGEVFNVLLAILEVNGFTAVKSGTLYKIIKIEGARQRPVPTIVGAVPDPERVGDEIITQIVPVRFASVADMTALLRPLISAQASLIPYRETNLLMITDSASNIRRLLEIVRLVDVEGASAEVHVIPLKHADAEELAKILKQLFAPGRLRQPAPPAVVPAPAPAPQSQVPPAEGAGPKRPPIIAAYPGANVVIVHARKPEVDTIRQLVTQLDADIYVGRRVLIYFPEHVRAQDLVATMNAIYGRDDGAGPDGPAKGEVRFVADETANAVIAIMSSRAPRENKGSGEEGKTDSAKGSHRSTGDAPSLGGPPIPTKTSQTPPMRVGAAGRLDQGFVLIDVMPPDAEVFLDGRLLGRAQQLVARAFPVRPGRHSVEIVSSGFRPYRAQVSVRRSFPTQLRVVLEPE